MRAAVDAVVDEMNFIVRGIARGRLRDSQKIAPTLSIRSVGADVEVVLAGEPFVGPADGSRTRVKSGDGDPLVLRYHVDGPTLVQTFEGESGGKRRVFRRDGDRLVCDVTVFSKKLPKDLRYRLTYAPR